MIVFAYTNPMLIWVACSIFLLRRARDRKDNSHSSVINIEELELLGFRKFKKLS